MGKKLTHEFVSNEYAKEGYTLKSQYKKSSNKDELICPEGHDTEIRYNDFQQKVRCSECHGNKKLTHEIVFNYYQDNGYYLKSIYKNALNKDTLICPVGHVTEICLGNFKSSNNRCVKCSGLEKHTQEFVEGYYKDFGYILESEYINQTHPDRLICPNNHITYMTFSNFKHNGSRCYQCYRDNNFGENNPRFNPNREELQLNDRLRIKRKKTWLTKHMKDDPNYKEFLINPDSYVLDHVIPISLFCKLYTEFDLNETELRKIINKRENLQLLTEAANSNKRSKGSIDVAKQYLIEHGISL